MTWEDRTAAYDAGVRAATAHVLDGARLASPWGPGKKRTLYWKLGADRTLAALNKVIEARP